MPERSQAHAALGRTIRSFRADRSISQEELGYRSGLDRTYVGGIERGERNPGFENFLKLARALEVGPSELLKDVDLVERRPGA